ncbi:MAG: flagellar motor switch protein FliG [Ilumatobacter sp.]|uniref:flagellar motor switch protein FliG n=1 Tax=Ilumatobacter sp. TaxID=1967498 RepID=UPI00391D3B20
MSAVDVDTLDDTIEPPVALTGAQKAAILLLKLGRDRAASIMKLLDERAMAEVSVEIARAGSIPAAVAEASLMEFVELAKSSRAGAMGGVSAARQMLESSVGAEEADRIMGLITPTPVPFEFIAKAEPKQVINVLSAEHPQTVALVLAHLAPDVASPILGGLGEDMQRDVSIRVAKLERTSPEVIAQLESMLQRRFGSAMVAGPATGNADGVQTLVDILNRSDRTTERAIFEGLESTEAELAENIRRRMFVFEDIVDLDDKAIQLILRNVDSGSLATALKGVRQEVKEKVTKNMSERAAKNLEEEIQLLGQIRLATVEEAQVGIVQQIRVLEESGEITIARGSEEFVE